MCPTRLHPDRPAKVVVHRATCGFYYSSHASYNVTRERDVQTPEVNDLYILNTVSNQTVPIYAR